MKHIKDAHNLMKQGDGPGALDILDHLLELAPRNSEALRMKAEILDYWGHFDVSFDLLKRVAAIDSSSPELLEIYEERLQEEREALVFSELTPEGRWYFAFPQTQMWVSIYGFLGCAAFLLLSSNQLNKGSESLVTLLSAFGALVLLPWIALIVIHFRGIKKILVGIDGIKICYALSHRLHKWDEVKAAVVEYDPDLNSNSLIIEIYGHSDSKIPLERLQVSSGNSVVRARRHFMRSILTYIDNVTWRANPKSEYTISNHNTVEETASERTETQKQAA